MLIMPFDQINHVTREWVDALQRMDTNTSQVTLDRFRRFYSH